MPGTVALTFEDGPYIYTDKILQLLDEHNAKATFFVTGNNLGKKPIDDPSALWGPLLKRIHESGHQLGSHGYAHENLAMMATTNGDRGRGRQREIVYNEMAFRNVLGFFPRYLRPPHGACSRASGCMDYVTKLGYRMVNWNVDLADTSDSSWQMIQGSKSLFDHEVSIDHTVGRYIIRMHDVYYQTAYNLTSYVLDKLDERGYYVVTVGECIGDPKENWYINA
jgi:peptidoglycan/xylan/chitin deacetylase (PgdA/CDA1 family)